MAKQHGPTLQVYFTVFATLLVMTGVTVWAAFQDFGAFNNVVAMGIAGFKATIVVLYFMHVKYESKLVAMYASIGVLFVALLLIVTMAEVDAREPAPAIDPLSVDVPAAASVSAAASASSSAPAHP